MYSKYYLNVYLSYKIETVLFKYNNFYAVGQQKTFSERFYWIIRSRLGKGSSPLAKWRQFHAIWVNRVDSSAEQIVLWFQRTIFMTVRHMIAVCLASHNDDLRTPLVNLSALILMLFCIRYCLRLRSCTY